MKRYYLLCYVLFWASSVFALDANLDYAVFQSSTSAYIELYFQIAAHSLQYQPIDSINKQATADVVLLFKEKNQIVQADKFRLLSPVSSTSLDFIDLKRYTLQKGDYQLEVEITDPLHPDKPWKKLFLFTIDFQTLILGQSHIQLLSRAEPSFASSHPFYKQKFILEPLPKAQCEKNFTQLLFYNEVYPNSYLGNLQIRYFVKAIDQNKPLGLKIAYRKTASKPVIPLVLGVNIEELPTGDYELVIEIRDSIGNLFTQSKKPFYRNNPYHYGELTLTDLQKDSFFVHKLDETALNYALKALLPKINPKDNELLVGVLKNKNIDAKRLLLLNFWIQQGNNEPEPAFTEYMQLIKAVDREFKSGFRNGFETDRGYYYIKYGRPDDIISVEDEPSAPPYEIWSYNYFPSTRQSNVRFLFYNPSLAGGDYILLHATAFGERNNPNWEIELYRNAPTEVEGDDPFGATQMKDNFGRRARKLMSDF
jgi:GWxTD domain-containing protein